MSRNQGKLDHQTKIDKDQSAKFVIGCSDEDFQDGIDDDDYHVVPPDGGWGWVVVVASFMCNMVVDGIIFTIGMLFPILRESFGASNAQVAWIASLLGGFYLLVGPFVSSIANAFGFRTVCILGAIVGAVACAISYFATNIYYLYISFGILGGMGFGLIYVPAVIATGFYFEKKRALATGIAVCGSGIGTFIVAPMTTYVITNPNIKWNTIFLIYSGILLTCIIYGFAFRPLSASTGKRQKINEDMEIAGTPLLIRIKRARDLELEQCPSALSMSSAYSRSPSKMTMEDAVILMNGDAKVSPNMLVARTLLDRHSPGSGIGPLKRLSYSGNLIYNHTIPEEAEHSCSDEGKSENNLPVNEENKREGNNSISIDTPPDELLDGNKNVTNMGMNSSDASKTVQVRYPRIESAPLLTVPHFEQKRRLSQQQIVEKSRPFYRDDIFYSGSLARIAQYQSSESIGQYHASVTRIPPCIEEESEPQIEGFRGGTTAISSILKKIFDFSLLLSPTFVVISCSGFMALLALFVPFNFLPSYATALGFAADDVSFLMALIGICNTVGRVIAGWISDHPKVDALMVNNVALIVGGIATVVLPFIKDLSLLYCYSILFGLCVAAFASLRSILLVELLGLEKLTNAFGLLLFIQGIAATFGSPIAVYSNVMAKYTKDGNTLLYKQSIGILKNSTFIADTHGSLIIPNETQFLHVPIGSIAQRPISDIPVVPRQINFRNSASSEWEDMASWFQRMDHFWFGVVFYGMVGSLLLLLILSSILLGYACSLRIKVKSYDKQFRKECLLRLDNQYTN